MKIWRKIKNRYKAFVHRTMVEQELNEEIQFHLEMEIEKNMRSGMSGAEARKSALIALGGFEQTKEECRDSWGIRFLSNMYRDTKYAFRQLYKSKVTTSAAILSLALGFGACTTAFRLIDGLLLRPLPVSDPGQLYAVTREGIFFDGIPYSGENSWAYPAFLQMREAVKSNAELLAISEASDADLSFDSGQVIEKGSVQYVSGWMFDTFGLLPAAGRLLSEADDLTPGANAYVVLSYDYWNHRFGRAAKTIGRTLLIDGVLYEIVGVAPEGFKGTEPGKTIDIYIPTMMNQQVALSDATWFRTFVHLKENGSVNTVTARLNAVSHAFEENRSTEWTLDEIMIDRWLNQKVILNSAKAGVSETQLQYKNSLFIFAALVALVLLIACANVANLLIAQGKARSREMALRVSLGANRRRLIRQSLVESMLLALPAAMFGILFGEWAAPAVVNAINPPDDPVNLTLPLDWRVFGFSIALAFLVTSLFGLVPALRVSAIKPADTMRDRADSRSHFLIMRGLITSQVGFCFLVVIVAGLFVAAFHRLSNQPIGFSANNLLALETATQSEQSPEIWYQVAEHLREIPGVESIALTGWPLLSGRSWNGTVTIDGTSNQTFTHFLNVSAGWLDTMKITLLEGQDFQSSGGQNEVALVNQEFARVYFSSQNPVGKQFSNSGQTYEIIGLVENVPYKDIREDTLPQAYFPFHSVHPDRMRESTLMIRTLNGDQNALAALLKDQVKLAHPDFSVTKIRTQSSINDSLVIRERLLAYLAWFFGCIALLLSGIGLYGVINYFVFQRRREIGIRIALGAKRKQVLNMIISQGMGLFAFGAICGLIAAIASTRLAANLLHNTSPTDPLTLITTTLIMAAVALLACSLPAHRAARTEPLKTIRYE